MGLVLKYDLPSLIGFMLESICYGRHRLTTAFGGETDLKINRRLIGICCVIFATFVRIRLKRINSGSRALLYLITTNFIACTASLAVDVSSKQTTGSLAVNMAANVLYTCIDFISQVILVSFLAYDSVSTTDENGIPFH